MLPSSLALVVLRHVLFGVFAHLLEMHVFWRARLVSRDFENAAKKAQQLFITSDTQNFLTELGSEMTVMRWGNRLIQIVETMGTGRSWTYTSTISVRWLGDSAFCSRSGSSHSWTDDSNSFLYTTKLCRRVALDISPHGLCHWCKKSPSITVQHGMRHCELCNEKCVVCKRARIEM